MVLIVSGLGTGFFNGGKGIVMLYQLPSVLFNVLLLPMFPPLLSHDMTAFLVAAV
jgi:hypothetical protein